MQFYYNLWGGSRDKAHVHEWKHYSSKVTTGELTEVTPGMLYDPTTDIWTKDRTAEANPLAALADYDTLLVPGHGSAGNPNITETEFGGGMISAVKLARFISDDQLPKTHRLVRCLVCHGGAGKGDNAAFAQSLAISLGQAYGYRDIAVCGYKGVWHVTKPTETKYKEFHDKNYHQWYDWRGQPLLKKPTEDKPFYGFFGMSRGIASRFDTTGSPIGSGT